jgi:hypothetical protein
VEEARKRGRSAQRFGGRGSRDEALGALAGAVELDAGVGVFWRVAALGALAGRVGINRNCQLPC